MDKNIICEYDDFIIFEDDGKFYYKESDNEEVKEVVFIGRILLEPDRDISDGELMNPGFDFDISGELFNEPFYCYWNFAKCI